MSAAVGTSSNVIVSGDGYTTHTFTTPGTFTCLRPGVADVLVVGGGGGGGSGTPNANSGGGGGGGGVQYFPNYNIRAAGTYTVTVGTGGPGGNGPGVTRGTNGGPSRFMEIVSFGGGGGGCFNLGGLFGGSGGGGGRQVPASTPGIYGQGNSGAGGSTPAGGAGGGALTAGSGLVGGAGISYPAISTNVYGAGGLATGSATGVPATGNGGGGNGNGLSPWQAGAGGPGIVMIRYLTQGAPQGYETVYTGETTIGSFAGYNSPTANVQVFHGASGPGSAPYTWVKPTTGTFARIECVGGGAGGTNTLNSTTGPLITVYMGNDMTITTADQTTVLTGAQIEGLGISVAGGATFTSNTISYVDTTQKMITVQMNGTNIVPTVTPVVGYTLTLANTHFGTTTGVYGRGVGGSGGGYAFGTIPLTELSPTVAVSVGGGGASFATGTASTFGPFNPLYGSITGGGAAASQALTSGGISGAGGLSYGAVPSNIFTGGIGVPARTGTVASGPSYSAYGGSGGGNTLTGTIIPSLFAGDGGVGISTTGAITPAIDGGYPGGGGGGGRSPGTIGGGRGGAGRVRIIVY